MIIKIRLISIFNDAATCEINNCNMHMILPNIYRSKGNQIMKLRQLIEYKMRNIFLEKSLTKVGGETITRPFSKKLKLSIYLDQQSQVL